MKNISDQSLTIFFIAASVIVVLIVIGVLLVVFLFAGTSTTIGLPPTVPAMTLAAQVPTTAGAGPDTGSDPQPTHVLQPTQQSTIPANETVSTDQTPVFTPVYTATIVSVPTATSLLTNTPAANPTTALPTATTPPPTITSDATVTQETPTTQPVQTGGCAAGRAGVCNGTITLNTYDYQGALVPRADFPYPDLNHSLMGPPSPVTYDLVFLENDSIRLAFMPALGARLYQITDKASGHDLLYNNPVVKPTTWGPPELEWWIAVGGMEWNFPVYEHGYAWGSQWAVTPTNNADGSASVFLSFDDPAKGFRAEVTVTLPATGRSFTIAPALVNNNTFAQTGQLWINTPLPAGEGMALHFPADIVLIDSAGQDEAAVPGQIMGWDNSLANWGTWITYFGAYAWPVNNTVVEAWGAGSGPGLQRQFDPGTAPGVKFFTIGPFEFLQEQYDGGPYFELWGGLTSDFSTSANFAPGERRGWFETWKVVNR